MKQLQKTTSNYFFSLKTTCCLTTGSYFFKANLAVVFFLFFCVVYVNPVPAELSKVITRRAPFFFAINTTGAAIAAPKERKEMAS
mmetsp:Transcript_10621/g.18638  ORF Transcript_10621/g.18638 Transcript_10621/m.18638 type:complete len:85 (-) Transcript_10621:92-346(-)